MRRPQVVVYLFSIVLAWLYILGSFLRLSVSEGKPYYYSLEKLNMFFYTVVKKLRSIFLQHFLSLRTKFNKL